MEIEIYFIYMDTNIIILSQQNRRDYIAPREFASRVTIKSLEKDDAIEN